VRVAVLNSPTADGNVSAASASEPLQLALLPLPVALAVEPRVVPTGAPRDIVVTGEGFTAGALCSFSDTPPVAARLINASALVCRAPALAPGAAAVRISVNSQQWSAETGVVLVAATAPVVSGFAPALGPEVGGTRVRFVGEFFDDGVPDAAPSSAPLAFCRFGRLVPTPAVVIAAGAVLVCSTPALDIALEPDGFRGVAVAVSTDGGASWTAPMPPQPFVFHAALSLSTATPAGGPADGGALVVVTGTGFLRTALIACRFGDVDVAAAFINATAVRCAAPPLRGTVAVSVALNGADFTASPGARFTAYAPPLLTRAVPWSAPVATEANITLLGAGFLLAPAPGSLTVRFGASIAPAAAVINASALWAMTPAASTAAPRDDLVAVSFNGGASWSRDLPFPRLAPETVLSLAPASVAEDAAVDIFVTAANLVASGALACRFTHVPDAGGAVGTARGRVDVVVPTWISAPSGVVCRLPPSAKGRVYVALSNSGGTAWSPEGPAVAITPRVIVAAADPAAGAVNGGTIVALLVLGLPANAAASANLLCRFGGGAPVPALVVDVRAVECVAPAVDAPGSVHLDFSADGGASWAPAPSGFTFHADFSLVRVTPDVVPRGVSAALIVTGEGFYDAGAP
jgi:hypothetical protein